MTNVVQEHYGSSNIVESILAAIPWSRTGDNALAASQLFAFDQLHGRELLATKDHAARLSPADDKHLLDVGSGIGGPARYLASTFGCRVTGIDLTPDFVTAATDLTNLCGLDERANFVLGNAEAMPFKDGAFDDAICLYVGMNLPDRQMVLNECARVLKSGGRLLWTEVTAAQGVPHYPLPWALTAETSHVDSQEALLGQISNAGFEVVTVEDETAAHVELAQKMKASGVTPSTEQRQANEVVLGAGFVERRSNYIKSLSEGRVASTLVIARKPS